MRCRLVLALLLLAPAARGTEMLGVSLTPPHLTVYGGAEDQLHARVAGTGDLNDDGIEELAIATATSVPGIAYAGITHVRFGPFADGETWDLVERPGDLQIVGRAVQGYLGRPLLVADLNADGIQDLLFGYTRSDRPDATDSSRGEVGIFFGPLRPGLIDLSAAEADLWIQGAGRGHRFGTSIGVSQHARRHLHRSPPASLASSRHGLPVRRAALHGEDVEGIVRLRAASSDCTSVRHLPGS